MQFFIMGIVVHGTLNAEYNLCGVEDLPARIRIPNTQYMMSVGELLAETDSSYICKVENYPDLLLKINREHNSPGWLFYEANILLEIEDLDISPKVFWVGNVGILEVLIFQYVHGSTLWEFWDELVSKPLQIRWKNDLIQKGIEQIQVLRKLHEHGGYMHLDAHLNNWIVLPSGGLMLIDFGRAVKIDDLETAQFRANPYNPPLDWLLSPWEIEVARLDRREDIFRVILELSNMLSLGGIHDFYAEIANYENLCLNHKKNLDLFNPTEPPGELSRLVQGLQLGVTLPYDEIIVLLEAMKQIFENTNDDMTPAEDSMHL